MRGRPYAQATGEILRVIGRAHVPSGLRVIGRAHVPSGLRCQGVSSNLSTSWVGAGAGFNVRDVDLRVTCFHIIV
jgi:hypothetical protein